MNISKMSIYGRRRREKKTTQTQLKQPTPKHAIASVHPEFIIIMLW